MQFHRISILPPTEWIGISWGGVGDSVRPKKRMKPDWYFQRGVKGQGGGGLRKIPSVGKIWIISGTTCYNKINVYGQIFLSRCLSRLQRLTYSLRQSGLTGLLVGQRSSPGRLNCPQSLHSSTQYLQKCTHPGNHKFKYVHNECMLYTSLSTVFILHTKYCNHQIAPHKISRAS